MAYIQKTMPDVRDVEDYIGSLPAPKRQEEARLLIPLFERITGEKATMWGNSIVGFGAYDYLYASGHSGSAARTGFSCRKAAITFYLFSNVGNFDSHLQKLGKHKAGKGCIYVNKLEDIDLAVLEDLVKASLQELDLYLARENEGS